VFGKKNDRHYMALARCGRGHLIFRSFSYRGGEAESLPLPGDPFLTRAIVFLGEDWYAPSHLASERQGYAPKFDRKTAVRHQLKDMQRQGYPGTLLEDGLRWWAR